jgi:alpha-galactosidase
MNIPHQTLQRYAVFSALLVLLAGAAPAAETYDVRIRDKEILTPLPAAAPRINGPKVYGARPGKIFVYRIPCQGERPLRFEAQGLPPGLELDTAKGVITGTTPAEKGRYPVMFIATNARGAATRPFTLVVGDQLALTPPTGWNSWGGYMLFISDAIVRKAADLIVARGLADVGFQYVSIDDCWMRISPENYAARAPAKKRQHEGFDYDGLIGDTRDADGRILPNKHFPDMKALTDYVHSHGLRAGLYSSPGPFTCQNFAGSAGHEQQDAEQYARWGFDLLKYDQCSAGVVLAELKKKPGFQVPTFWQPMADAIRGQNRDILFNLCQYGQAEPWTWAPTLGMQSWRIGGDLNHHVDSYFTQALRIATELRAYSKPGQWNDPDYMYIHKIRDFKKMVAPTAEIPLDTNQRYQYVTLWSIIGSPFFFSCDIDAIDDFTIRLLSNADVLNINQDELGDVAQVIRNKDDAVLMLKRLADGSKVLAVFNRNPKQEARVEVSWGKLGICCEPMVYDVWRQKDVGAVMGGLDVYLSPNGVGLFVLRE